MLNNIEDLPEVIWIFLLNKQLKNPNTLKEFIICIVNCENTYTYYDFIENKRNIKIM